MTIENIYMVVIAGVSYIFGILAKKFNWVASKYIPAQNFIIGIISAFLYYIMIDNSNIGNAIIIAFSGLTAGGLYDLTRTNKG